MLVGHVTKDGSVAGPRTLEHLVDVVLHFDGDSRGQLRMVRALKNRYGPTDEFGCFELGEYGLIGLPDPSGLFLSERHDPVPGTCVTVTLEGRRPLLAEVQTLVCEAAAEPPRRVVSGLDSARVGMMIAVLQRRAGLQIGKRDVFAATVGGVRLTEPSVDLAVGLAVASAVARRERARRPRRDRRGRAGRRDPPGDRRASGGSPRPSGWASGGRSSRPGRACCPPRRSPGHRVWPGRAWLGVPGDGGHRHAVGDRRRRSACDDRPGNGPADRLPVTGRARTAHETAAVGRRAGSLGRCLR